MMSSPPIDADVGDIGEDIARGWASQAGITPNPVMRDKGGWDFCFQILRTPAAPTKGPFDQLPPDLTCMVQVKTTAVGAESATITLSNWHRMVASPLPWFILRVFVDDAYQPTQAYLVHVGEQWIERVLRRLRDIPPSDNPSLHRMTLDLSWTADEALSPPFPMALRSRLVRDVGDMSTYSQRKLSFLQTVGYGDGRQQMLITPAIGRTPTDIELAVDFAIGLAKRLPVNAFTVNDVRFGVSRVIEDKRDIVGHIELPSIPPMGMSRLTFSTTSKSVTVACKTYTPMYLFPSLPLEYLKARFVAPGLSVITKPDLTMTVAWELPGADESVSLEHLSTVSAVLSTFASAEPTRGVEVHFEADGKRVPIGRGGFSGSGPSAALLEFAKVVDDATYLAKQFDIRQDSIVMMLQLESQQTQFAGMRSVLDRTRGGVTASVRVSPSETPGEKRSAIVLAMSARLGERVLAAVASLAGNAVWDAETSRLTWTNAEVGLLSQWSEPVSGWNEQEFYGQYRDIADDFRRRSPEMEVYTAGDAE